MAGVSRGRIVSAIITSAVLTGMVAGVILFVSQQDRQQAQRSAAQARATATATATGSATAQFTPAPGITVTVSATPTHGASSSSSSSTTAYTGGANGGVTYIVPPRYPTPVPTSGASAGGGVTPTPTATSSAATPTATSPTATPTPALKDDATVTTYSPTSLNLTSSAPSTITVSLTMLNTGASTWDSSVGYAIKCQQFCWQIWGVTPSTFSVAPGQTFTFTGYLHPQLYLYATGNAVWQMYSPRSGYFGQQAVIPVVVHGYYSVLQEASPACENDGAVWTRVNSVGTVTCQSGDLALAQGGPGTVSLALTSIPSSYNYSDYEMTVHVHFTTTSATTYAGVILSMPTSANYNEEMVFMVSPAGQYCYTNLITICYPPNSQPVPSSDYDISVQITPTSSYFSAPGAGGLSGPSEGGGATGLVEMTAAGSTDAAYFSNYQLYQYK